MEMRAGRPPLLAGLGSGDRCTLRERAFAPMRGLRGNVVCRQSEDSLGLLRIGRSWPSVQRPLGVCATLRPAAPGPVLPESERAIGQVLLPKPPAGPGPCRAVSADKPAKYLQYSSVCLGRLLWLSRVVTAQRARPSSEAFCLGPWTLNGSPTRRGRAGPFEPMSRSLLEKFFDEEGAGAVGPPRHSRLRRGGCWHGLGRQSPNEVLLRDLPLPRPALGQFATAGALLNRREICNGSVGGCRWSGHAGVASGGRSWCENIHGGVMRNNVPSVTLRYGERPQKQSATLGVLVIPASAVGRSRTGAVVTPCITEGK